MLNPGVIIPCVRVYICFTNCLSYCLFTVYTINIIIIVMIIYSLALLEASLIRAMKEGGGKLNSCNITLHGPPGVGKTSLKRVILGQRPLPKDEQNSTNIMENPARAISTNRLTAAKGQLIKEVNNDEIIKMLAKKVRSLPPLEPQHHDSIEQHNPVSVVYPVNVSMHMYMDNYNVAITFTYLYASYMCECVYVFIIGVY